MKFINKNFLLEVVSISAAIFCAVYMLYVERYFSGPVTSSDVEYYHVIYLDDLDEGKGPIRSKLKDKETGKSIVVDYYPFHSLSKEQRSDMKVGVVNHLGGRNIYDLVSLSILDEQVLDSSSSIVELNAKNKKQQEELISLFLIVFILIVLIRWIKMKGKYE